MDWENNKLAYIVNSRNSRFDSLSKRAQIRLNQSKNEICRSLIEYYSPDDPTIPMYSSEEVRAIRTADQIQTRMNRHCEFDRVVDERLNPRVHTLQDVVYDADYDFGIFVSHTGVIESAFGERILPGEYICRAIPRNEEPPVNDMREKLGQVRIDALMATIGRY